MTGFFAALGTFLLLGLVFDAKPWSGNWWACIAVAVCAGIVAASLAPKSKDES